MPAYFAIATESMQKHTEFAIRIVTNIQSENVEYVSQMIKRGREIEVKHIDGNIRKFAFSRTEAIEISHTLENGQPEEIVWS
jgi:hypothetical protein